MNLTEVREPDQRATLHNGRDTPPDGHLLAVAELQQALRELRSRRSATATNVSKPGRQPRPNRDRRSGGHGLTTRPSSQPGVDVDEHWIGVLAAHAGAGASTVALAIADGAAAAGRKTHLVETAHPTRSGLVATASNELGVDPSGAWRRGRRSQVTVHRRTSSDTAVGWPTLPPPGDDLIVIDLGLPTLHDLGQLATSGCRLVLVCRPTVPGVRRVEQVLTAVTGPVAVAAIGTGKWSGAVTASLGPRLRDLRARGAVVTVPIDRRLEITGPTTARLPKPITNAGRSLLALIDAAHPDAVPASTQSMPRTKGTR